ncbi:hypothetical protein Moror_11090 [Moniliophthora roreri MCA 2997]|uniref:F-box domain-containing protein n=1 Tax=Moniliophthora roreri (strain MCA 2997) TaxID=1381753 RepID=V2WUJ3_MONRO|nr:hypothetical protein Moror_11090 [Moniliophthora roreri MCA 2997]
MDLVIPMEVIKVILHHSSRSTLLAACLVSKQLHCISMPRIYKQVSLRWIPAPRIIRVLKTLHANSLAAQSVRKLTFRIPIQYHKKKPLYAILRLLFDVLMRIPNLETLNIDSSPSPFPFPVEFLPICSFPFLKKLHLTLPTSTYKFIISFLKWHGDTLEVLILFPYRVDPHFDVLIYQEGQLSFASLRQLSCHYAISPLFANAACPRLSIIDFRWYTYSTLPSSPALITNWICGSRRQRNIKLLAIKMRSGLSVDLIERVSSEIPTLEALEIDGLDALWGRVQNDEQLGWTEVNRNLVGEYISRLPNLRIFLWSTPVHYALSLDQQYELVALYGDKCLTLVKCSIPGGACWKRISGLAWYPETLDYAWIFNHLKEGTYPALEALLEHIKRVAPEFSRYVTRFRRRGLTDEILMDLKAVMVHVGILEGASFNRISISPNHEQLTQRRD